MSDKGKNYELSIKNEIMERTEPNVTALRPDFSGSSKYGVADVVVVWDGYSDGIAEGAFLELKKRTADEGKRSIVMAGSSKGESGMDELQSLVDGTPPWAKPYLVVSFNNREIIMMDASTLLDYLTTDDAMYAGHKHGVRATKGGNISMVKPTLDVWNSASAGMGDVKKILNYIGVDKRYIND